MIKRTIENVISEKLKDRKVIIILGPRQVGKSTLLKLLNDRFSQPLIYWNGDEADIRAMLKEPTSTLLRNIIGENKTVIIDEAQRIENIGLCIKLIYDNIEDVKVIATGSSAFEISNKINEPLTGRKWEFNLYPISFDEMVKETSLIEEKRLLRQRLIYGYYPDIVNNPGQEEELLLELSQSFLYKDILTWERIQKPDKLEKLIQALAFQIGQLVNYNELGQLCGLNNETVERYIDLLEKSYIVFRLTSFSRNLRNELKKSNKIYFYDNGIRNAVINQFSPVDLRSDKGQLWENWFVSERKKFLNNNKNHKKFYFWRTLAQQEIDLIEIGSVDITAFECKWNEKAKGVISKSFTNAYPESETHFIHPGNYDQYLI